MKEKPNYYAILPSNVRYSTELTSFTKLLYAELTALSNFKGYAYCSNWYLQNLFSVSARTITRSIGQLVEGGYVESKLIYKNGTKQVEARHISINEYLTPRQNCQEGIDKNGEDNNTRENNTSIIDESFERAWAKYGKKGNKRSALLYWRKLSGKDRAEIEASIPEYLASRDVQYRKDFSGYINPTYKRWQDKVIVEKKKIKEY